MIRRFAAALVVAIATTGTIGLATPAQASSAGSSFVAQINAERVRVGRAPFAHRADLAALALQHAQKMAARNSLHHNTNLAAQVSNWRAVGENVGFGGNARVLHAAFMNSPAHRANILDKDFTEVGLGVTTDSRGVMWVTEVFRQPMRAAVASAVRTIAAPAANAAKASRNAITARKPARTASKPARKPARSDASAASQAPRKRTAVRWATTRPAGVTGTAAQPSWITRLSQVSRSTPSRTTGALPQAVDYLHVVAR